MKRVCAWCQSDMGEGGEGEGLTHGICDDCLEQVLDGQIGMGQGSTKGRCPSCNVVFTWTAPVRLKVAVCPHCQTPLRETHVMPGKALRAIAITRPPVRHLPRGMHAVRMPAGVRS
jgi:hypothetical protein